MAPERAVAGMAEDIGTAVGMRKRSAKRVADINIEWKLLNIYGEPEAANCAA
jgi:hypothetical protein